MFLDRFNVNILVVVLCYSFAEIITSWKNWIEGTWLMSVVFLKTVYESTITSKQQV